MVYETLLAKYPIISDQITRERLAVVLSEMEKVLQSSTPGAVVEFGCYIGTTSLFIRRLLDACDASDSHPFHVYDSFSGLPEKTSADSSGAGEAFVAGALKVSKKKFIEQFQRANVKLPAIHKAWFDELTDNDVPKPIAFAFLDGDFYESIISSLQLVWPRLSPNAIITIDDYQREALPGVERAVTQFLADKPYRRIHTAHNVAIIAR